MIVERLLSYVAKRWRLTVCVYPVDIPPVVDADMSHLKDSSRPGHDGAFHAIPAQLHSTREEVGKEGRLIVCDSVKGGNIVTISLQAILLLDFGRCFAMQVEYMVGSLSRSPIEWAS